MASITFSRRLNVAGLLWLLIGVLSVTSLVDAETLPHPRGGARRVTAAAATAKTVASHAAAAFAILGGFERQMQAPAGAPAAVSSFPLNMQIGTNGFELECQTKLQCTSPLPVNGSAMVIERNASFVAMDSCQEKAERLLRPISFEFREYHDGRSLKIDAPTLRMRLVGSPTPIQAGIQGTWAY